MSIGREGPGCKNNPEVENPDVLSHPEVKLALENPDVLVTWRLRDPDMKVTRMCTREVTVGISHHTH